MLVMKILALFQTEGLSLGFQECFLHTYTLSDVLSFSLSHGRSMGKEKGEIVVERNTGNKDFLSFNQINLFKIQVCVRFQGRHMFGAGSSYPFHFHFLITS